MDDSDKIKFNTQQINDQLNKLTELQTRLTEKEIELSKYIIVLRNLISKLQKNRILNMVDLEDIGIDTN